MSTETTGAWMSAAMREKMENLEQKLKTQATKELKEINIINSNKFENIKPSLTGSNSLEENIKVNNIKRDYTGLKAKINSDKDFTKAMDEWGFDEPGLYRAARDHGFYTVREIIQRLSQLRDGYFNPKYGAVPQQRGRLLNNEIQKLRTRA